MAALILLDLDEVVDRRAVKFGLLGVAELLLLCGSRFLPRIDCIIVEMLFYCLIAPADYEQAEMIRCHKQKTCRYCLGAARHLWLNWILILNRRSESLPQQIQIEGYK